VRRTACSGASQPIALRLLPAMPADHDAEVNVQPRGMRVRGAQVRRARAAGAGPPPPPDGRLRFWQALAVVALVAATAGWATVAVITLRPAPAAEALASPTTAPPADIALPSEDASVEPPVLSHAVADLEALLPAELNGTSLTRESWTGDTIQDDPWIASLTTFLTGVGKTPADLQASQAYDPVGTLDLSAGVFRVADVVPAKLLAAMIAAWKENYPDLKTAQASVGGFDVTTGDFGQGQGTTSYWYLRGGAVFDIETTDPTIAQAALAALPTAGASSAPSSAASASPSATVSPSSSPSPS
jgi:hypothetical protein